MGGRCLTTARNFEAIDLAEMALKPEGEESGSTVDKDKADSPAEQGGAEGGAKGGDPNDLWRTESELRESVRLHAERALAWRRRALAYEESFKQAVRRHGDELAKLSGQLLLYEARTCRGWKELCRQLSERDAAVARLQRVVRALRARLAEAGVPHDVDPDDEADDVEPEPEPDSLDDSDSAVIMDDEPRRLRRQARCWNGDGVGMPVARSVSDALDSQCKYSSLRRGNGFLRRPEVLETVYSVEEDADNAGQPGSGQGQAAAPEDAAAVPETPAKDATPPPISRHGPRHHSTPEVPRGRSDSTSFGDCSSHSSGYLSSSGCSGRLERSCSVSAAPADTSASTVAPSQVTAYNRVMSNHRSVTKPKDVKYKRINKAKSKSLEELRGRLRNWVDKGTKVAFSVDHSYA